MQVILTNSTGGSDVISFAFYSQTRTSIVSQLPNAIVLHNPDTLAQTTLNGTGLSMDPITLAVSGTLNGWTTVNNAGQTTTTVTGINWPLDLFVASIDALFEDGNDGPWNTLLSLQPISVDASGFGEAANGLNLGGILTPLTFLGSPYGEEIQGGEGDDIINPGDARLGNFGDELLASPGNDTYDFAGVTTASRWTDLVYQTLGNGISANIDGASGTGSIAKGASGTDTLQNMGTMLDRGSGGFFLSGTDFNDAFTINAAAEQFIFAQGGKGVDSYTIMGEGVVHLNFSGEFFDYQAATDGLTINVGTGTIGNDGFGNAETLDTSGMTGRVGIQGTFHSDAITGSDLDETFITNGGDDTIDGGSGTDLLVYDRHDATSRVEVDLGAGTATGAVNGTAFSQILSSMEDVIGTDTFGDLLTGSDGDNYIDGRGGTDWITPGAGSDTVVGGAGSDMVSFVDQAERVVVDLAAGTATSGADTNILQEIENVTGSIFGDLITGDANDNRIRGLGDYDWLVGSGGNDTFEGGNGRDTVAYSSASSGVWASLVSNSGSVGQAAGDTYDNIQRLTGSSHDDRLAGDNDRNTLRGLGGDDFIFGNGGRDRIDGGAGNDFLSGGNGNDRLRGGRGVDTIDGGFGWDAALYSGNVADYDIISNADGTTSLFHNRGTQQDGIDLLTNVQVLEFADGKLFL